MPHVNVLKDYWNKHQNMLFHSDMVEFSYLLNSVGTCIFYTFQPKPDISHLISFKPTVMKRVYCQNFSVTERLNCNTMKFGKHLPGEFAQLSDSQQEMNTLIKWLPTRSNPREISFSFGTGKQMLLSTRERTECSGHQVEPSPIGTSQPPAVCSSFPARGVTGIWT